MSNPTAIGVDDRSRLFVGTQDGQILTADFGSLANVGQPVVSLATTGSYGQGRVNGFSFLPRTGRHGDSDYVLATASSAVLQSGNIAEMTGESYTDYGGNIVNVVMYGGAVYVCGLMGICRFGQTSKVYGGAVYAMCEHEGDLLSIVKASDKRYDVKVGIPPSRTVCTISLDDAPTGLAAFQYGSDIVYVVSTSKGVYCSARDQKVTLLSVGAKSVVAGTTTRGTPVLYLVGNDDKLKTVEISVSGGSVVAERVTDRIIGLKTVRSASNRNRDTMHKFGSTFAYADGSRVVDARGKGVVSMDGNVVGVRRIASNQNMFGSAGLFVWDSRTMKFVDETLVMTVVSFDVNSPVSPPDVEDVRDVFACGDDLYVVADKSLYLCQTISNTGGQCTLATIAVLRGSEDSGYSYGFVQNGKPVVVQDKSLFQVGRTVTVNNDDMSFSYASGEGYQTVTPVTPSLVDLRGETESIVVAVDKNVKLL